MSEGKTAIEQSQNSYEIEAVHASEEETPAEIQVSLELTERTDEQEVVSEDKPAIEQNQILHEIEAVHASEEGTPAEIQVSLE